MKYKLFIWLFLFICHNVWGQDISITTGSEEMDSTQFSKIVNRYNEIIRVEHEEIGLIKLDLLGPLLFGFSQLDSVKNNLVRLSYEKKFRPDWSYLAAFELQANRIEITALRWRAGTRYYFNMEKRILRGKSANNFSASYFSGRISLVQELPISVNTISFDLLFGIQRRLWKYGFIDFDIGIENIVTSFGEGRSTGIDLISNIQIGIAF